jgi:hypothetical protein
LNPYYKRLLIKTGCFNENIDADEIAQNTKLNFSDRSEKTDIKVIKDKI